MPAQPYPRTTRLLISVLGAAAAFAVLLAAAHAQTPPPVTVSAIPESVTLAPGGAGGMMVVVGVAITDVDAITLTAITDSGVAVYPAGPETAAECGGLQGAPCYAQENPAPGNLLWGLRLAAPETGFRPGDLHLLVSYVTQDGPQHIRETIAITAGATAAAAAAGDVRLSVNPGKVTLRPGGAADVSVVAEVPITNATALSLRAFTDTGVSISPIEIGSAEASPEPCGGLAGDPCFTLGEPPAAGALLWGLRLAAPAGIEPGDVHLLLGYDTVDKTGVARRHYITDTIQIAMAPAGAISSMLSVALASDLSELSDLRERNVHVVISNTSNIPIDIVGVRVQPIPFVTVAVGSAPATPVPAGLFGRTESAEVAPTPTPFTLAPQQVALVPIRVAVGNVIQPGDNLLLAAVDAEWQSAGTKRFGAVTVSRTFKSGVYGEDAVLNLLGVPLLLFVPGVIAVVSYLFFARLFRVRSDSEQAIVGVPDNAASKLFGLLFKNPNFWFWSFTISLLVFFAYSVLVRNLLVGYGFPDIARLWLIGAILGFLAALGHKTWMLAQEARKARAVQRHVPDPTAASPQWNLLEVIANNRPDGHARALGELMECEVATYPAANGKRCYVVPVQDAFLPPPVNGKRQRWLSRRVNVRAKEDARRADIDFTLRTGSLDDLKLETNGITLGWEDEEGGPWPKLVTEGDYTLDGRMDSILRLGG